MWPIAFRQVCTTFDVPACLCVRVFMGSGCMFCSSGALLFSDISFCIEKHEHLMIAGPSGSGKSTLLRIIAGLWPVTHGQVKRPNLKHCFFLPQRPYIVEGSLRAQVNAAAAASLRASVCKSDRSCLHWPVLQILYPQHTSEQECGDAELVDLLRAVGLQYLLSHEGAPS